jgi:cytochrome c
MRGLAALVLIAGFVSQASAQGDLKRGETLVAQSCSACHAIGRAGDSPVPAAPQFRILGQKYPISNLQEALAEGIAVGHRGVEMPEYTFEPDQIDDIIAYLESIQTR